MLFSDLFFFFFDFFGDIFLVVSLGYTFAWPWPLQVLVVLLWLSVFFSLVITGISEGWDNILGRNFCQANQLGPVGRGLVQLSTALIGPVILLYLHDTLAHRIRCKEKQFKSLNILHSGKDQELNQLNDWNSELVSLVDRRRQLARMLARAHQMHVIVEEVLQLFCQLLIVYLTATAFRYPGLVGWFGKSQGLLFVLYLSITWSKKLASSFFLKQQDTAGLLGKFLIYLRTFLKVGIRLATLALFLAHILDLFSSPAKRQQLCSSGNNTQGWSRLDNKTMRPSWNVDVNVLLSILTVHIVLVTILKLVFPSDRPEIVDQRLAHQIYRSLCHAVNSLVLSTPPRNWKKELTAMSQQQLCQEWRALRWEYVGMEGLHLAENLLLLVWCGYQLPLEVDQGLSLYHNLVRYSPVWLVLLTLVKVGLFEWYNQSGHPLARLLKEE